MWWSWVLTAAGLSGLILAGQRKAVGWALGVLTQVLWISYAVATSQWGFIVSALAYATVYARNWISWRRSEMRSTPQPCPCGCTEI